jgi:glycosyltransferase involved in cell wall biosynthesis
MTIRILHIATGLGMGGAEMALTRLLERLPVEFENEVLSFTTDLPVGPHIRELGVQVHALSARPGVLSPRLFTGVAEHIRRFKPDVIQTWMYHADLIAGLAARFVSNAPVLWNIRNAIEGRGDVKLPTYAVIRTSALLSRWIPRRIICCAESAKQTHIRLGYVAEKIVVIPNGYYASLFKPDLQACLDVRRELGLVPETKLIGLAARFDPQKDHANFLHAAALLHHKKSNVHFVLWGHNVDKANPALMNLVLQGGIKSNVHLLGLRIDAPRLTAALDIASLSSAFGEAFPNVVGEAMACGVPCAVTDVGDAARIVSDTGFVVPRRDPAALARAWADLLDMSEDERAALGLRARQRIIEHFSIEKMAAAYSQLYKDIIASGQKSAP